MLCCLVWPFRQFLKQTKIFTLIIFAFIFSSLLGFATQTRYFSKDTIVMIASYFCVALAIILNDIWIKSFSFTSYIIGDVITVGNQEIRSLIMISVLAIFYTIFAFKKILLINVNEDLAKIENIKTELWKASFLILLTLIIALSVRIVGVFLMTALLVLPAAIARIFSTSPKQMIILSLLIGTTLSALSFKVATVYNLMVSSTIIVVFSLIFITSLLLRKLTNS